MQSKDTETARFSTCRRFDCDLYSSPLSQHKVDWQGLNWSETEHRYVGTVFQFSLAGSYSHNKVQGFFQDN